MKKHLLLLIYILLSNKYCYSQNLRPQINISNDFYTIKISEGVGKVNGSIRTVEKNGINYFKIENASFKTILERVFPYSNLKFIDNSIINQYLNVDLIFQGISLDEFQPLFIQQISNYFPVKITGFKSESEKWTLQKQDSSLLSKKIHTVKLMDAIKRQYSSLVSFSSDGEYKAEGISLNEFGKKLSQQIHIPIENKIESKSVYDFELKISNPIDYENIKKQLESFGFQIITEKYNNETLEISSK